MALCHREGAGTAPIPGALTDCQPTFQNLYSEMPFSFHSQEHALTAVPMSPDANEYPGGTYMGGICLEAEDLWPLGSQLSDMDISFGLGRGNADPADPAGFAAPP